jgi:uncharacterized protein (TIGR04255 family)
MSSSAERVQATGERPSSMDFDKPPVVETSLGFFIAKITGWNVLHFGALWEHFRNKYPLTEFPPPIIQPILGSQVTLQWSASESMIPLRALFTDESRTQLVQIQNDFFLHNWRKTDKTPDYTHFEQVLPLFKQDWSTYLEFLKAQHLDRPKVLRCEMSYFNHIVRGQDWEDFEDLSRLFRMWRGFEKGGVFRHLESAAFNIAQSIGKGKAQIFVTPGVRAADGKEILQMNLTASTVPNGSEDNELFEALTQCHQIALKAFDGFVTDESLKKWGMKR